EDGGLAAGRARGHVDVRGHRIPGQALVHDVLDREAFALAPPGHARLQWRLRGRQAADEAQERLADEHAARLQPVRRRYARHRFLPGQELAVREGSQRSVELGTRRLVRRRRREKRLGLRADHRAGRQDPGQERSGGSNRHGRGSYRKLSIIMRSSPSETYFANTTIDPSGDTLSPW